LDFSCELYYDARVHEHQVTDQVSYSYKTKVNYSCTYFNIYVFRYETDQSSFSVSGFLLHCCRCRVHLQWNFSP